MRFVELVPMGAQELASLMERAAARHLPLQSLATSTLAGAAMADGAPIDDPKSVEVALARWATNPYAGEGVTLYEPLIWWAGSTSAAVAVVFLPSIDASSSAEPFDISCEDAWQRPWVLALGLRRTSRGIWELGPERPGAFWDEDASRNGGGLTLRPVPQEWIGLAVSDKPDSPAQRALIYAHAMHSLSFGSLTGEDGAFGSAWASWSRDARGRGRTDQEYVALAVRYFAKVQTCRRPVEDLAKVTSKTPIAIRKALQRARGRDLLTEAASGTAGGRLTTKGMVVLAEMIGADLV